jgi:hypothetical protein
MPPRPEVGGYKIMESAFKHQTVVFRQPIEEYGYGYPAQIRTVLDTTRTALQHLQEFIELFDELFHHISSRAGINPENAG